MHIKIISVGKTKEQYLKEGIAEYEKRLSTKNKVEWIYIPEYKVGKNTAVNEAKSAEAEKIIAQIKDDEVSVALDENGTHYDSHGFASVIEGAQKRGKISFIIGGQYGLAPAVIEKATHHLSLSKLTFTHQMVRLILCEQIYRAQCIIDGKQYHY